MRNRIIPYRKDLKMKARRLRKESTSSEVFLWLEIKNRALGVQFHRQVPMLDFIVDFYCHEMSMFDRHQPMHEYHSIIRAFSVEEVRPCEFHVTAKKLIIYTHEIMLAIEIDGKSHNSAEAAAYDAYRQKKLEKEGVIFLRFDDLEVKCEMSYVVNEIFRVVNELKGEK